MAWAVSNNAWADRVDGEEDGTPPPPVLPSFGGAPALDSAFPSLGDAAAMPQPTKKEKKKGGKPTKMSLADFNSGTYKPPVQATTSSYSSSRRRGEVRDEDIMSMLPKGPAGYDPEEQGGGNRLGGGFKGYGGDRGGGGYGDRDREGPRRGFGDRGGDEEREDEGPSRADMDDDWGASRKFVPNNGPSRGGYERRGGYDTDDRPPREDMGPSRADESDNWGKDRKPLPAPEPRGGGFDRGSGGSRGFSDYGPDRGLDRDMGPSRADTEESWGRRGPLPSNDRAPPSGPSKADTEDRWSRAPAPAPTSSQAPAERPRLKLAPRTKPIENPAPPKPDPSPAAAPAPTEPRAPKANPFGTARPREEVLKEQGKDPIKEDLKLEAAGFIRDDTPEESKLKEELEELKKKAEAGEDVKEAIASKETDIETLRLVINDKLRFAQKNAEADKAGDIPPTDGKPTEEGTGAEKEPAPAEEN